MIEQDDEQEGAASPPGWTDERLARLLALWAVRTSAGRIAKQLGGGLTRSAVAGKLFRLGLTRDAEERRAARAEGARASHERGRLPRAGRPTLAPTNRASGSSPQLTSLIELTPAQCRWPREFAGETYFCGHPVRPESPYCPAHHQRAYLAKLPPLTLEQVRARSFSPLGDLA